MRNALLSDCGTYRYRLGRHFGGLFSNRAPAVFCMLNPSTADSLKDDATIRRCISYAERWGRSGLVVVNLYALRSTDPAALAKHDEPVGPDNDKHIRRAAADAREVICAWGAHARPVRVVEVMRIFDSLGVSTVCLGTTKDGAPRHPLRLRADEPLVPWRPAA